MIKVIFFNLFSTSEEGLTTMPNELCINSLNCNNIFPDEFLNFTNNNKIKFSHQGIAVIYAPNGTGKTTLARIFSKKNNTHFNVVYNGNNFSTETEQNLFYIIEDQNRRNIIQGNAQEFFIGNNIRREYELKELLNSTLKTLLLDIATLLKDKYKIATKTNKLIDLLPNEQIRTILRDIVNKSSKGGNTSCEQICSIIDHLNSESPLTSDIDNQKLSFLTNDFNNKNSFINLLYGIQVGLISPNTRIRNIEKDDEAVRILNMFPDVEQCIVCDNEHINVAELIETKSQDKEFILGSLNGELKPLIVPIISTNLSEDPFNIKSTILDLLETGNPLILEALISDIDETKELFIRCVEAEIKNIIITSGIHELFQEYSTLRSNDIELHEEDYLYIQEIINSNVDKELKVDRDSNGNIVVFLDNSGLIGKDRNELPLSTGEQNFLSICFELLKAKNSNSPIIVLDDPISSFDSIYKNKIAYAIIKILQNKKIFLLTHNTDLLRLLDSQYSGCFRLYLFNKNDDTSRGFLPIKDTETSLILRVDKLLKLFRENIYAYVEDFNLFLI